MDSDIARLGRAIVKYGKDLNVNMNTLKVMAQYKDMSFPNLYLSEVNMDSDHVQDVWVNICRNCLNRLDNEQRFKLLAQIFLNCSFYWPSNLFKKLIASFSLTTDK